MPIKVITIDDPKIVDALPIGDPNTIRVKPTGKDRIKVDSNCSVDTKRLEAKLNKEIEDRIEGDENLQNQIDEIKSGQGDEKSINLNQEDKLQIKGFEDAQESQVPIVKNGNVSWGNVKLKMDDEIEDCLCLQID